MNEHIDPARLVDYVEGRLDRAEMNEVEQHVAGCGECSAELALARRYVETPVAATIEDRSERLKGAFSERLAEQLEPGAKRRHHPRLATRRGVSRRWLGSGLLAASIAVIGLGLLQLRSSTRPGEDELGQQTRSENLVGVLQLDVQRDAGGSYTVHWMAPTGTQDLRLHVIASDGSLVLEQRLESNPVVLQQTAFAQHSDDDAGLLIQIVGTDPSGAALRSVPQRIQRVP